MIKIICEIMLWAGLLTIGFQAFLYSKTLFGLFLIVMSVLIYSSDKNNDK